MTNKVFDINKSRRKALEMKKKEMIIYVLNDYPNFDTSFIVSEVKDKFRVNVSERHVQRIRKEICEKKGNSDMTDAHNVNEEDVFDTSSSENSNNDLLALHEDDISVINLANEGGWTVQQISDQTGFTEESIRDVLESNKQFVTGEVLDEENSDVYLSKETQEMIDEIDSLPGNDTYDQNSYNVNTVNIQPQENFWEVEQECVSACSKVEKSVDVFMNTISRRKAMLYMKWAGAREWLAYLLGKFENGVYYITDLYLPDQQTTATLVDKVDNSEFNKLPIVGVIHSHHEMGAGDADRPSFSGHDDNFINSNHNLSLLAGKDRGNGGFKVVGIARSTTPCGSFIKVKAKVKQMVEDPEGDKRLKDEFLKKTQTINTQTYPNYNNGYGYGHNPLPNNVGGRTYSVGSDGLVQTRVPGFHFTK